MTANLVAYSRASKEFSLLEEIFFPRARNDRIFLEDSSKDSLIVTSLMKTHGVIYIWANLGWNITHSRCIKWHSDGSRDGFYVLCFHIFFSGFCCFVLSWFFFFGGLILTICARCHARNLRSHDDFFFRYNIQNYIKHSWILGVLSLTKGFSFFIRRSWAMVSEVC